MLAPPPLLAARKLEAGTLPARLRQAAQASSDQALPNGGQPGVASGSSGSSSTSGSVSVPSAGSLTRGSSGGSRARATHSRPSKQSTPVSSRTVSQGRSKSPFSQLHSWGRPSLLGSSDASDTSSTGAGSAPESDPASVSSGSSGSDGEDARWLPWLRFYLPWPQRFTAGAPDAELAEARLLVRRRRERELRRLHQGSRGRRLTGVAKLKSEAWDLRGQPRMRRLMLAEARCLAAVSATPGGLA